MASRASVDWSAARSAEDVELKGEADTNVGEYEELAAAIHSSP